MSALWHRLRFFAGDAWDELRHSPGVNLLAVGTLVAVLFGSGLFGLVLSNIQSFVTGLREDARIEVYLRDGIDEGTRQSLRAELQNLDGVTRVEYIDKEGALQRYSAWAGEMAFLIEELENNPLPASFEVFISPGPDAEALGSGIQREFASREGVEQVRFDRELLNRLEALLNLARFSGGSLGLLILGTVVFVMASVLRLAVFARRDEIEIMLLVGATPAFVRGPFLVAGVVQGVVSSVAALVMIELARRAALSYADEESLALLALFLERSLPGKFAVALIAVGLAVSCSAAWFAVRRSRGLRGPRG